MAKKIQAITAYRPRFDLERPASAERFWDLAMQKTTLSSGVVKNVQESEVAALIGLLAEGRPVHTGVAIYTPTIRLDGTIHVHVRVDRRILRALNAPGAPRGKVINAENVGKTAEELAQQWNEAHPDDPVA